MSLPPILTDARALADLAEQLRAESIIAVDLEADSLHSYREKVCLLQISTPKYTVLVDPLPMEDMSALGPVLADAGIRKIFHAADYDIRCLYRDFGFEVRGLFDTMIASQMLGAERVGLADVLHKHLGITLDKRYQRADWSKRPLEEGMIRYAMKDTCYLHRLAVILEERLVAKGRLAWAQEEFALLEQVRPTENSAPLFTRVKGAALLERAQLAVLERLLQWRDREACRRDRPPFKVIGNNVLLGLARSGPCTLRAMQGIEGLSPRLLDRYGRQLLEVVETARALPAEQWPSYPRGERRERDPAAERRLKTLKRWRTRVATELAMDPGILINNEHRMQAFAKVFEPGTPVAQAGRDSHPPRFFARMAPGHQPRPAWAVLADLSGREPSLPAVRRELEQNEPRLAGLNNLTAGDEGRRVATGGTPPDIPTAWLPNDAPGDRLRLLATETLYGSELLSDLSPPLQAVKTPAQALLHPRDAARLKLKNGKPVRILHDGGELTVTLRLCPDMAPGLVIVPRLRGTALEALVPGGAPLYCQLESG